MLVLMLVMQSAAVTCFLCIYDPGSGTWTTVIDTRTEGGGLHNRPADLTNSTNCTDSDPTWFDSPGQLAELTESTNRVADLENGRLGFAPEGLWCPEPVLVGQELEV